MIKYKKIFFITILLFASFLLTERAQAVVDVVVSSNLSFCYTITGPPGTFNFCDTGQTFNDVPDGTYCGTVTSGPAGFISNNRAICMEGTLDNQLTWPVRWVAGDPASLVDINLTKITPVVNGRSRIGVVLDDYSNLCDHRCRSMTMTYTSGSTVTLTEQWGPAGAVFVQWGGACSGSNPTCAGQINSNTAVTATFNPGWILGFTRLGTGWGTVTDNFGRYCDPACTSNAVAYPMGSTVTLTAVASPSSVFTGWGGDCPFGGTGPANVCSGPINRDLTISGTFTLVVTPTPTPTPTPTSTPTPTPTPTSSVTPTPSVTPIPSVTPRVTLSPTPQPTNPGGSGPGIQQIIDWNLVNPLRGGSNNIVAVIILIVDWIFNFAGSLIVILIIYSGVRFIISRGNPGEIQKAKGLLKWALIGFVIVLIGKGFVFLADSVLRGEIPTFPIP